MLPQREHTKTRLAHVVTMMTTAIVSTEDNEAFVFLKWDDNRLDERVLEVLANQQTAIIRAGGEHLQDLLGWNISDLNSLAQSSEVEVQSELSTSFLVYSDNPNARPDRLGKRSAVTLHDGAA